MYVYSLHTRILEHLKEKEIMILHSFHIVVFHNLLKKRKMIILLYY